MEDSIYLLSNKCTLSPSIQELTEQTIELMKLDIIQGMAQEQEPQIFNSKNSKQSSSPSNLGTIVSKHLKRKSTKHLGGKRPHTDSLPINELYNAESRTLARRHNINLISSTPVLKQIEPGKAFAFAAPDLANKNKIEDMSENIFDTQVEPETIVASPQASLRAALPQLNLAPGVARMLSDTLRDKPDFLNDMFNFEPLNTNTTEDQVIELNQSLKFRIHRVKCIDETNPEWPGDDEIAMGGVAIPSKGEPTKIQEFRVGNSFDDGESKTYSPPRVLKTFALDNLTYPANFSVAVALAEKDNGGLSDFITELWKAIKNHLDKIIVAIGVAAGAAAGAAIGGTTGTAIGGPLGSIIGAVAGLVLGALISWLISALKDDIFEPQMAAIRLPNPNTTFAGGSLTSPIMNLNFRGYGGFYRAYYSWKVNR